MFLRTAAGVASVCLATACTTVPPQSTALAVDPSQPKYNSWNCKLARQAALASQRHTGEEIGVGVGMGVAVGFVALPLAIVGGLADAEEQEALSAAVRQECLGPDTLAVELALTPSQLEQVGQRFGWRDHEAFTDRLLAERRWAISAVTPEDWRFNDGSTIVNRRDLRVVAGSMGAHLTGFRVGQLQSDREIRASFVGSQPDKAPVRVRLRRLATEALHGRAAVRVALTGYSPAGHEPGRVDMVKGSLMSGELLLDAATGVVLAGEVRCLDGNYAMRRVAFDLAAH